MGEIGVGDTDTMKNNIFELYTEKDKQRFWSYVDIREPDQCWNWRLIPNRFGYGIFSARNKLHRTQRFIKLIQFGAGSVGFGGISSVPPRHKRIC